MRTSALQTIVLLALLCACFSLGSAMAQETEGTTSFNEIKGKVLDSRGKPVESFSVTITVYDYTEGGWSKQPKTVKKWEGVFEDGEFQFDVDGPIPFNSMTYLSRRIVAEGFLELGQGGYQQLSGFSGTFQALELARGIKVMGKVVLPDSQGDEELADPRLIMGKQMSSFMPDFKKSFNAVVTLKKDGSFEQTVPENCNLLLTASASNAASFHKKFKIPKAESADDIHDLGELKLKEGTRASGVVLDRDGKPVEGQVVQIKQQVNQASYMQNHVYGHAVSDADGKFQLPPREGKCDISLVKSANIKKKLVKPKGKLLLAKSVSLNLEAGTPADNIEIHESKTWKIHGVVNYEGDKPSISSYVESQGQAQIEIDDDGRFEFEIIDGAEGPYIIIYSSGSETQMALLSRECRRKFKGQFRNSVESESQYFQFKKVTSDIGPLEFTMVKQIPDNRTVMEQIFDWYYFGE